MKPVNQEMKIEYKLDTASTHYDAFKGEQLAIAADGKVIEMILTLYKPNSIEYAPI